MWKILRGREEGDIIGGVDRKKNTERERIWVKGSRRFLKDLFESAMPKHLV